MSNLATAVASIAERINEHSETIQTEEAVKTSVILPFLRALGYDVFDPSEVIPEFTADAPGKKGEKVDYAIQKDGGIILLIECKGLSTQLNQKHLSQLFRYFTATQTRFALLTNGREYQFYTDLDQPNRMDTKPFFVFDLLDFSAGGIAELAKFSRSDFSEEAILAQAERLRFVASAKRTLEAWFEAPPDDLIRLVASEVHDGRLTAQVRETLGKAIVAAMREILRERFASKLTTAFEEPVEIEVDDTPEGSAIETTEEEIEGFLMVKALLRGTVEAERITMRDAKSYCAVLLDNNNRKPLARLHFNGRTKSVGLFDGDKEERVQVESLDEMLEFGDRLKATVEKY